MKPTLASKLVRLYPRRWRERYGVELQELLKTEPVDFAIVIDLARAAAFERFLNLRRSGEEEMRTYPASLISLVRKPSAFIPLAMSLCAFAVVMSSVAALGTASLRAMADEGTAAHIWQLLIAGQPPVIAFFALKWLARDRTAGLTIMAIQLAVFGAALLPVWLLGL